MYLHGHLPLVSIVLIACLLISRPAERDEENHEQVNNSGQSILLRRLDTESEKVHGTDNVMPAALLQEKLNDKVATATGLERKVQILSQEIEKLKALLQIKKSSDEENARLRQENNKLKALLQKKEDEVARLPSERRHMDIQNHITAASASTSALERHAAGEDSKADSKTLNIGTGVHKATEMMNDGEESSNQNPVRTMSFGERGDDDTVEGIEQGGNGFDESGIDSVQQLEDLCDTCRGKNTKRNRIKCLTDIGARLGIEFDENDVPVCSEYVDENGDPVYPVCNEFVRDLEGSKAHDHLAGTWHGMLLTDDLDETFLEEGLPKVLKEQFVKDREEVRQADLAAQKNQLATLHCAKGDDKCNAAHGGTIKTLTNIFLDITDDITEKWEAWKRRYLQNSFWASINAAWRRIRMKLRDMGLADATDISIDFNIFGHQFQLDEPLSHVMDPTFPKVNNGAGDHKQYPAENEDEEVLKMFIQHSAHDEFERIMKQYPMDAILQEFTMQMRAIVAVTTKGLLKSTIEMLGIDPHLVESYLSQAMKVEGSNQNEVKELKQEFLHMKKATGNWRNLGTKSMRLFMKIGHHIGTAMFDGAMDGMGLDFRQDSLLGVYSFARRVMVDSQEVEAFKLMVESSKQLKRIVMGLYEHIGDISRALWDKEGFFGLRRKLADILRRLRGHQMKKATTGGRCSKSKKLGEEAMNLKECFTAVLGHSGEGCAVRNMISWGFASGGKFGECFCDIEKRCTKFIEQDAFQRWEMNEKDPVTVGEMETVFKELYREGSKMFKRIFKLARLIRKFKRTMEALVKHTQKFSEAVHVQKNDYDSQLHEALKAVKVRAEDVFQKAKQQARNSASYDIITTKVQTALKNAAKEVARFVFKKLLQRYASSGYEDHDDDTDAEAEEKEEAKKIAKQKQGEAIESSSLFVEMSSDVVEMFVRKIENAVGSFLKRFRSKLTMSQDLSFGVPPLWVSFKFGMRVNLLEVRNKLAATAVDRLIQNAGDLTDELEDVDELQKLNNSS